MARSKLTTSVANLSGDLPSYALRWGAIESAASQGFTEELRASVEAAARSYIEITLLEQNAAARADALQGPVIAALSKAGENAMAAWNAGQRDAATVGFLDEFSAEIAAYGPSLGAAVKSLYRFAVMAKNRHGMRRQRSGFPAFVRTLAGIMESGGGSATASKNDLSPTSPFVCFVIAINADLPPNVRMRHVNSGAWSAAISADLKGRPSPLGEK